MKVTNNPDLVFKSIKQELFRTYKYANGPALTITAPIALHVSKSGGHRVLDSAGVSHYVAPGWYHLFWRNRKGAVAFAF